MASFAKGVASILDGMASIMDSAFPSRRSPETRRILEDLRIPDAKVLKRDATRVRGWYDLDPWYGPPGPTRPWPHGTRSTEKKP